MRNLLLVLLLAVGAYALDDMTFANTYVDSQVLTHTQLNQDNDSVETWIAKTNDSLDVEFMRFTDLTSGDSTLSRIQTDTIASDPVIDSISGPTYIDRINPDTARVGSGGIVISEIDTATTDDTLKITVGAKTFRIVIDDVAE